MTDTPRPLRAQELSAPGHSHVFHGFFTRQGGVSTGIYKSLNTSLGSADLGQHVVENRRRVAAALAPGQAPLVTAHQIHSDEVITVHSPFSGPRPQADALVTNVTGIALGVLTADCGPVLFADAKAHVIAAAHAGWRGALAGILENTVAAMQMLGAKPHQTIAVLGPCIGPRHYEVGKELRAEFLAADKANTRYFVPSSRNGHFYFNLWLFIADRLQKTGVKAATMNICTYADSRFFSYRRSMHNHAPDYGRQISAIVLAKR